MLEKWSVLISMKENRNRRIAILLLVILVACITFLVLGKPKVDAYDKSVDWIVA